MKHSFGTIFPGHQSHGTPRGQCRPVLEAQGNSRNRARSQTPIPRDPGVPCSYPSTQALPESEFQHIPDQPEYGTPQALCFLIPSVLGMGWALPEGIRGSSLTQDLEGDFGAVLRPGGKNRKLDGKRDRGLKGPSACSSRTLKETTLKVWERVLIESKTAVNKPRVWFVRSIPHSAKTTY